MADTRTSRSGDCVMNGEIEKYLIIYRIIIAIIIGMLIYVFFF